MELVRARARHQTVERGNQLDKRKFTEYALLAAHHDSFRSVSPREETQKKYIREKKKNETRSIRVYFKFSYMVAWVLVGFRRRRCSAINGVAWVCLFLIYSIGIKRHVCWESNKRKGVPSYLFYCKETPCRTRTHTCPVAILLALVHQTILLGQGISYGWARDELGLNGNKGEREKLPVAEHKLGPRHS